MNQRKVCVSFNGLCGSLCDCGQSCEPAPEQAGGSRVLRAYFDKAGQYDWTAPDIRNGLSYPALVRLKGSGAGGESAFRAGCTYGGVGGGEGCLVECEFMLVPGRTYHLTVGKGGLEASYRLKPATPAMWLLQRARRGKIQCLMSCASRRGLRDREAATGLSLRIQAKLSLPVNLAAPV